MFSTVVSSLVFHFTFSVADHLSTQPLLKLLNGATMPPPACQRRTDASQSSHCPSRHGAWSPLRGARATSLDYSLSRRRVNCCGRQLGNRYSSRSVCTRRADSRRIGHAARPVVVLRRWRHAH